MSRLLKVLVLHLVIIQGFFFFFFGGVGGSYGIFG
jgi:hypothetical protein